AAGQTRAIRTIARPVSHAIPITARLTDRSFVLLEFVWLASWHAESIAGFYIPVGTMHTAQHIKLQGIDIAAIRIENHRVIDMQSLDARQVNGAHTVDINFLPQTTFQRHRAADNAWRFYLYRGLGFQAGHFDFIDLVRKL